MMKLISLSEFVEQESKTAHNTIDLAAAFRSVVNYNEFLSTKLTLSMFQGEKPIFGGFTVKTKYEGFKTDNSKSICPIGESYSITINDDLNYQTFHYLQTIGDMVGKVEIEFDESHPEFGWKNNFINFNVD